jgi:calmodulin-regulated spectrin-associated protein
MRLMLVCLKNQDTVSERGHWGVHQCHFPVISTSACILSIFFACLFSGTPVGDNESHSLAHGIKGLQITSGNRTYRIPSPTRPSLSRNSFQQQESDDAASLPSTHEADQSGDGNTEKGFYISFESDMTPKRPKPPLRVKRSSPKKVHF